MKELSKQKAGGHLDSYIMLTTTSELSPTLVILVLNSSQIHHFHHCLVSGPHYFSTRSLQQCSGLPPCSWSHLYSSPPYGTHANYHSLVKTPQWLPTNYDMKFKLLYMLDTQGLETTFLSLHPISIKALYTSLPQP